MISKKSVSDIILAVIIGQPLLEYYETFMKFLVNSQHLSPFISQVTIFLLTLVALEFFNGAPNES